MNRRDFLGQALKALALSPLLVGERAVKIIAQPTIADKIRLERPPLPPEEPLSPGLIFNPGPRSFSLGGQSEEWFTFNFDVRDGILYLWQ